MGEEQGLSAGKMHAIIVAELGEGAVVAARILGTLPSLSLADVGRLVRAGYMLGRSEGLQPPVKAGDLREKVACVVRGWGTGEHTDSRKAADVILALLATEEPTACQTSGGEA
jgi:hypothetical protein